ncbi:radical SAM family heme chaperone HemW [Defluviitalea saccharophila]|uniref:Heme chaperone HemW n=1 Tax=Defluviitalea saccharophila TaxID=879970 RepID=A0ABZ2Y543_9FIRM
MDNQIGLYIHIPFCQSKCYYCDFASYANKNEQMASYVSALKEEINQYGILLQNHQINTIFIGGGTPTVLSPHLLRTILQSLFHNFNIKSEAEITIESNPGTLDLEKLQLLKECHVNRLSIGLQAYQNSFLKDLGRIHTVEEFVQNYYLARSLGFDNINIDLMFSLPNQTLRDWMDTLKNVALLNPEHISCYSLTIEEDTPFGQWEAEGRIKLNDAEADRAMYHYAGWYLNKMGYKQYEISNFSKAGFLSKHNLVYWTYKPYIGMGLGAHSFYNGERYHNTYNLDQYIKLSGSIAVLKEDAEKISLPMQYAEYIFLGLRLLEGISVEQFNHTFQVSFEKLFGKKIEKLVKLGLVENNKNIIKLTPKGLDVSNTVFAEFLPE